MGNIIDKNICGVNDDYKLPPNVLKIVDIADSVLQIDRDTIVVALLSVLASLLDNTKYKLKKDDLSTDSIIIYAGSFQPTGIGKSSVASFFRKNLLFWIEEIKNDQKKMLKDKLEELNLKLKGKLTKSEKEEIKKEISMLENTKFKDILLDDATAEGLEDSLKVGSTPHIFIDEFGKYLATSEKDNHKKSYLTALQTIFDAGFFTTKKRRGVETSVIEVQNLGAFFASTINATNLTSQNIQNLVTDGFLNRVVCTFYTGSTPKNLSLDRGISLENKDFMQEFAKSFRESSANRVFYLSKDALSLYAKYLDDINESRSYQILNFDDRAGLTTRLLKLSTRIAVIFHLARNCLDTEVADEISEIDMKCSIELLRHLKTHHLDLILEVAKSRTGRLSLCDKAVSNIREYAKKHKRGMPKKNLCGNLRMYGKEFIELENQLLSERKIKIEKGLYYAL